MHAHTHTHTADVRHPTYPQPLQHGQVWEGGLLSFNSALVQQLFHTLFALRWHSTLFQGSGGLLLLQHPPFHQSYEGEVTKQAWNCLIWQEHPRPSVKSQWLGLGIQIIGFCSLLRPLVRAHVSILELQFVFFPLQRGDLEGDMAFPLNLLTYQVASAACSDPCTQLNDRDCTHWWVALPHRPLPAGRTSPWLWDHPCSCLGDISWQAKGENGQLVWTQDDY